MLLFSLSLDSHSTLCVVFLLVWHTHQTPSRPALPVHLTTPNYVIAAAAAAALFIEKGSIGKGKVVAAFGSKWTANRVWVCVCTTALLVLFFFLFPFSLFHFLLKFAIQYFSLSLWRLRLRLRWWWCWWWCFGAGDRTDWGRFFVISQLVFINGFLFFFHFVLPGHSLKLIFIQHFKLP